MMAVMGGYQMKLAINVCEEDTLKSETGVGFLAEGCVAWMLQLPAYVKF
jgi:hypothetical protein